MKRQNVFILIGCLMLVFAIGFVVYALNHPEGFFPWDNQITYTIYLIYLIATIAMFILAKVMK